MALLIREYLGIKIEAHAMVPGRLVQRKALGLAYILTHPNLFVGSCCKP